MSIIKIKLDWKFNDSLSVKYDVTMHIKYRKMKIKNKKFNWNDGAQTIYIHRCIHIQFTLMIECPFFRVHALNYL